MTNHEQLELRIAQRDLNSQEYQELMHMLMATTVGLNSVHDGPQVSMCQQTLDIVRAAMVSTNGIQAMYDFAEAGDRHRKIVVNLLDAVSRFLPALHGRAALPFHIAGPGHHRRYRAVPTVQDCVPHSPQDVYQARDCSRLLVSASRFYSIEGRQAETTRDRGLCGHLPRAMDGSSGVYQGLTDNG